MNILPRLHDRELVRRCLAGDAAAWAVLHRTYHRLVVGRLTRDLSGRGVRAGAASDLAQDVAAEVWFRLVADGRKRLRGFDPLRARLGTYLLTVARRLLSSVGTRRRLRSRREGPLPEHDAPRSGAAGPSLAAQVAEFVPRLTPRERAYFHQELLGRPGEGGAAVFTADGARQLKGRVFRKLVAFLDGR